MVHWFMTGLVLLTSCGQDPAGADLIAYRIPQARYVQVLSAEVPHEVTDPCGATPTQTPTPGPVTPSPSPDSATETPLPPTPEPDRDGDGYTISGGDCNDDSAAVHPSASEIPYDGIDQDCLNGDLTDVDGDGFAGSEAGGPDCDDQNPSHHPGAEEVPYDSIDQDCLNGDLTDVDGDGFEGTQANGDDCDDLNPSVNPDADETPYDSIDQDCLNGDLTDVDGDGFNSDVVEGGTDCDDSSADVHPGKEEICDLKDNDCDSAIDNTTLCLLNNHTMLRLWLRSDDLIQGDGTPVSLWENRVETDIWAEQAVVDRQPILRYGGVGGYPTIEFDGANDVLSLMESDPDVLEGLTLYIVYTLHGGATGNAYYPLTLGGIDETIGHYLALETLNWSSGSSPDLMDITPGFHQDARATLTGISKLDAARLVCVRSEQLLSSVEVWANTNPASMALVGGEVTIAPTLGSPDGTGWGGVGGSIRVTSPLAARVDISEVLVFEGALTDEEREEIEVYLMDRYGLAESL